MTRCVCYQQGHNMWHTLWFTVILHQTISRRPPDLCLWLAVPPPPLAQCLSTECSCMMMVPACSTLPGRFIISFMKVFVEWPTWAQLLHGAILGFSLPPCGLRVSLSRSFTCVMMSQVTSSPSTTTICPWDKKNPMLVTGGFLKLTTATNTTTVNVCEWSLIPIPIWYNHVLGDGRKK